MEKLNEFLRDLLSSCSDELRLEPGKNPYMIAGSRTIDIANAPILGTQISMMVFPLIPQDIKLILPHSPEIEFEHPHALGRFQFVVKKSPSGFNVIIRPQLSDQRTPPPAAIPEAQVSAPPAPAEPAVSEPVISDPQTSFSPQATPPANSPLVFSDIDSSSAGYEYTSTLLEVDETPDTLITEERVEVPAYEVARMPSVDVIAANDPEFATVFSDTSTYEPEGRRDDFAGAYAPVAEQSYEQAVETNAWPPPIPPTEPPADPAPTADHNSTHMTSRMDDLFREMAAAGASDLHLSVSMPPMIRKDGRMQPLKHGADALTADAMKHLLGEIMPKKNVDEFDARRDTDFAYEITGLARFRCNIFMDRKGMGAVFRIIPTKMTTAEQLGLSQAILNLTDLSKGLVVVTGPTGSGKSTTLCAMVNHINQNREDHIITIEDPIEFVHDNIKCLVNQREVHNHTDSFKDALRAALREDPDILLVGEMRDLETISIAIETAETGHLVFGTLHTTTAASTVDRIIDQFPADRQQQIRVMLSESLKGVIAQTLLPKKGGGRVAALEILIVTPAISNLIREGKTFQIPSAMQTGKNNGMVMLNDALFDLVKNGLVEPRDAYIKAVDKANFETMLTRGGFKI
ncbi:MAG TPA: type IV pilus twitching motility protein PilT [Pyrinomonadaceae bacterium]|nr:type IV pilus twitching motility protein PilT [Pyrinomonadaceae bacterium]